MRNLGETGMPRPSNDTAKARFERLLDQIPNLKNSRWDTPRFTKWQKDVETAVIYMFGESSRHIRDLKVVSYSPVIISSGTSDSRYQEAYVEGLETAQAKLESIVEEIDEYWEEDDPTTVEAVSPQVDVPLNTSEVFVIHGRDHGTKNTVARFLERLGLEPVILHEQPDEGRTIIEKFEQYATGFAVALLTPDDVGGPDQDDLRPRARQNVIFELGFFVGKFGRNRVCALMGDGVEVPSDYSGVLYIPLDESEGWKMTLMREMRTAGFEIDANRAFQ